MDAGYPTVAGIWIARGAGGGGGKKAHEGYSKYLHTLTCVLATLCYHVSQVAYRASSLC